MLHFLLILKNFITRNFLTVLGLSSVCFIFEACYGTPKGEFIPSKLTFTGQILSGDSLKPVKELKVTLTEINNGNRKLITQTDVNGFYSFGIDYVNNITYDLTVEDTDGNLNGEFLAKDTAFNVTTDDINRKYVAVNLKIDRK